MTFLLIFLGVALAGGTAAAQFGKQLLVIFLILYALAAGIVTTIDVVHAIAGPSASEQQASADAAQERADCEAIAVSGPGVDCSLITP